MRSYASPMLACALAIGFASWSVAGLSQDLGADEPAAIPDVADLEPAVDVGDLPEARNEDMASRDRVMDTLDLGTTSVTGSQELPKVLYIVPWKSSDLGDLVGRPLNTLLDEVLAPIDPEEFERHIEYYDALFAEGDKE